MTIGIIVNAIFFAGMGLWAMVKPGFITWFVGLEVPTADARNEVRAVYGGFGLAVAVLLVYAADNPELRAGVLAAVAVSLLGMALGRIVSAVLERPGRWPVFFVFMESALALLLLASG